MGRPRSLGRWSLLALALLSFALLVPVDAEDLILHPGTIQGKITIPGYTVAGGDIYANATDPVTGATYRTTCRFSGDEYQFVVEGGDWKHVLDFDIWLSGDRASTFDCYRTVTVLPGETAVVDIEPDALVEGTVEVVGENLGSHFTRVRVYDAPWEHPAYGHASLVKHQGSTYSMPAFGGGGLYWVAAWYLQFPDRNSWIRTAGPNVDVEIGEGETVTVDFRMVPGYVDATVNVQGAVITGGEVRLQYWSGQVDVVEARADIPTTGRLVFPALPSWRDLTLTGVVETDLGEIPLPEKTVNINEGETVAAVWDVEPFGEISGVIDIEGVEEKGIDVTAANGSVTRTAEEPGGGAYLLASLVPGDWTVSARTWSSYVVTGEWWRTQGYDFEDRVVAVEPAGTHVSDYGFPAGFVSGRMLDPGEKHPLTRFNLGLVPVGAGANGDTASLKVEDLGYLDGFFPYDYLLFLRPGAWQVRDLQMRFSYRQYQGSIFYTVTSDIQTDGRNPETGLYEFPVHDIVAGETVQHAYDFDIGRVITHFRVATGEPVKGTRVEGVYLRNAEGVRDRTDTLFAQSHNQTEIPEGLLRVYARPGIYELRASGNVGGAWTTIGSPFEVSIGAGDLIETEPMAPWLHIDSPEGRALLGSPQVTVSGRVWDPEGGFLSLTVDGEAAVVGRTGRFEHEITLSHIGENVITVVATDNAGNQVSVKRTVSISDPPTVTTAAPQYVSYRDEVVLEAVASDDMDSLEQLLFAWVQTDGVPVTLSDATTPSASFSAPESIGPLAFAVTVTDRHGNETVASVEILVFKDLDNAIFVSYLGNDSNDGGPTAPLFDIRRAIEIAAASAPPAPEIYAHVAYSLTKPLQIRDGVSLYGGFVYEPGEGWSRPEGVRSKLIAYGPHAAVEAHGIVNHLTVIDGFRIRGWHWTWSDFPNGTNSCALYASGCGPNLRISNCLIEGERPEPAKPDAQHGTSGTPGGDGAHSGQMIEGGEGGTGVNPGGRGGRAGVYPHPGENGSRGKGAFGGAGGAGGLATTTGFDSGGSGEPGADGVPGHGGPGVGAARVAEWLESHAPYDPERPRIASGTAGTDGCGGGGGGGAGGSFHQGTGDSGAGGGGGGGGGAPGRDGQAGGSSLAIYLHDASPRIVDNEIVTYGGAPAGRGGPGGWGRAGGKGGDSITSTGGEGGNGGHGAGGGGGGGGAGGASIGIFLTGSSAPLLSRNTFDIGPGGSGAAGGLGGESVTPELRGEDGGPGETGLSADIWDASVPPTQGPELHPGLDVGFTADFGAQVSGRFVAFLVREAHEGNGDLNGDGDALDYVVHVHDAVTGDTANLRLAFCTGEPMRNWSQPVVDGSLVAFVVSEAAQGGKDLNGDEDAEDYVYHLYDARTGETLNLGLAHSEDSVYGPVVEERADGGLVAFGVWEKSQGTDLDGNPSTDTNVIHVHDVATGTTTNLRRDGDVLGAGGGRVCFFSAEDWEGRDLNGDDDTSDMVPQVYDSSNGSIRNLGLAMYGSHRSVTDELFAFTVREMWQDETDLNDDGDTEDNVVHVFDFDAGTTRNLKLPCTGSLSVSGRCVAFTVPERSHGDLDLNGDHDATDCVVHVHDTGTGTTTNLGLDGDYGPLVVGDLVVFATNESMQGVTDLNGDGDTRDHVVHVHDLSTGETRNLGLAVAKASYGAGGLLAAAAVSEGDQGGDLNDDGDIADHVLHVFDAASGAVTNTGRAVAEAPPLCSSSRVAFAVDEGAQGSVDLNRDGDSTDLVACLLRRDTGLIENLGVSLLSADAWALKGAVCAVVVPEGGQGNADLNGDGDADDDVLHVDARYGRIEVEPTEIGLRAPVGASASATVTIRNSGSGTLTVTDITTTGPFSITAGPDTPRDLPPDASAEFVVTFAPTDPPPTSGELVISSDDPLSPEVRVPLDGVEAHGPWLAIAEPLNNDRVNSSRVLVAGEVGDADQDLDSLTINGVELDVTGAGGTFSREVTGLSFGENEITVVATDVTGLSVTEHLTVLLAKPAVGAGPSPLVFGIGVPLGGTDSKVVTILNEGNRDLTVTGLALSGHTSFTIADAPDTPFVLEPGNSALVTVEFRLEEAPRAWDVYLQSDLVVSSDDADVPETRVQLVGTWMDSNGNHPPVAIARVTLETGNGEAPADLWCDATLSFDPDGDELTYFWRTNYPLGKHPYAMWAYEDFFRTAEDFSEAFLYIEHGGEFTMRLTVADGTYVSMDFAEVTVEPVRTFNFHPEVDARSGSPRFAAMGSPVTLHCSAHDDWDSPADLQYSWSQTEGSWLDLEGVDTNGMDLTFTAPDAVEHVTFEVKVTDSGGYSSTDTVTIMVLHPWADPSAVPSPPYAVFLSEDGSDYDSGDADHPVRTLSRAAELASEAPGGYVYLGPGSYSGPYHWRELASFSFRYEVHEPLELALRGIYGGFDESFRRRGETSSLIKFQSLGLWLRDPEGKLEFLDGLTIRADWKPLSWIWVADPYVNPPGWWFADLQEVGFNAVGLLLETTGSPVISDCVITACDGQEGDNGGLHDPPQHDVWMWRQEMWGADGGRGGWGGSARNGRLYRSEGGAGERGGYIDGIYDGGHGGPGGVFYGSPDGGEGGPGRPGTPGHGGDRGRRLYLRENHPTSEWGEKGRPGTPGAGGGGGGGGAIHPDSDNSLGGTGGRGGCGGQAGYWGYGGKSGGGSFGVVVIGGSPVFLRNTITAGNGGDGGDGQPGNPGTPGGGGDEGTGGVASPEDQGRFAFPGWGGHGGRGGEGGPGGGGAGGNGGSSIGIYLWDTDIPILEGNDIDIGTAGAAGIGAQGGVSSTGERGGRGEDGLPGYAEKLLNGKQQEQVDAIVVVQANETQEESAQVPPVTARALFTTSWQGSDVEMSLVSPSGVRITRDSVPAGVTAEHRRGPNWESYAVTGPEPGVWTVELYGRSVPPEGEPLNFSLSTETVNYPPLADAGPDQRIESRSPDGATVLLDGSFSTDPDDDPLAFQWTDAAGELLGTEPRMELVLPLGTHSLSLTVEDPRGETDTDEVMITVGDSTPPRILHVTADPLVLWPPSHKMMDVQVTVTAEDRVDPEPTFRIVSISSNEPVNGTGDGDTSPDWSFTGDIGDTTAKLRAERSGEGAGRLYEVVVAAVDDSGNESTPWSVFVFVPYEREDEHPIPPADPLPSSQAAPLEPPSEESLAVPEHPVPPTPEDAPPLPEAADPGEPLAPPVPPVPLDTAPPAADAPKALDPGQPAPQPLADPPSAQGGDGGGGTGGIPDPPTLGGEQPKDPSQVPAGLDPKKGQPGGQAGKGAQIQPPAENQAGLDKQAPQGGNLQEPEKK